MFCRWCGSQLPDGSGSCPKCGKPTDGATPPNRDTVSQVLEDTKRAALELMSATTRLTERVASKFEEGAHDPKGTATRAARRVAHELDVAREEIEKAFREL
ncbi:MAG: zinc-ribbon domain-containing protein [Thermoplasmata archaeon]|nr:zinc-ribbon domain-containing protein [Thermoplasmata archaeon]